ncbi:uncharacterized protein LOC135487745 [Lineus longissimus]|uniref:uncharacterized protein LOC135487745 n=1 Tax=Lineus longissimus TaxID=88925 RepID=UPI00315C6E18
MEAVVPQSSECMTEYHMDNGDAGDFDYFLPSADYNSSVIGHPPHGNGLDHQLPYDKAVQPQSTGCLQKFPPQPENTDDYASNEVYMDNCSSVDLSEGNNYGMENDYGQDLLEERYTSSNESKPESATERVLCQLDEVLRQKINLELESFRRSLHVMLNDQRSNLQHLVRLASLRIEDDASGERRIDDVVPLDYENDFQASNCSGSGSSQSQTKDNTFRVKEEKLLCLIKLQTLASVITNNLRRQEYLT